MNDQQFENYLNCIIGDFVLKNESRLFLKSDERKIKIEDSEGKEE